MKMDQIEFEQLNEIFLLLRRRMLCFELFMEVDSHYSVQYESFQEFVFINNLYVI